MLEAVSNCVVFCKQARYTPFYREQVFLMRGGFFIYVGSRVRYLCKLTNDLHPKVIDETEENC